MSAGFDDGGERTEVFESDENDRDRPGRTAVIAEAEEILADCLRTAVAEAAPLRGVDVGRAAGEQKRAATHLPTDPRWHECGGGSD